MRKRRYTGSLPLNFIEGYCFAFRVFFLSLVIALFGILIFDTSRASAATNVYKDTLKLTYDGEEHEYTGVRGSLFYNHKSISFSSLPIIKIDGVVYIPAVEALELFGFETEYASDTSELTAYDENINTTVSLKTGESSVEIKRGDAVTTYSTSTPNRAISVNGASAIPCIPATKLFKNLGYTYSWSLSKAVYTVQKNDFFDWTGEKTDGNTEVNHIYEVKSVYDVLDTVGVIDLNFYGDLQTSFDSVTVDRTDKVISITLPASVYMPVQTYYDKFGEIVKDMTVSQADSVVMVTFNCEAMTEFAYSTAGSTLHLRLIWDYDDGTGNVNNFSLTIKRPSGVLLDSVTNTDYYDAVSYSKKFRITIKGDYVNFYKNNPVIINNSTIKKVTVGLNSSGNTIITVTTTKLQGYKIYKSGANFVVSMNTPSKLYKNIVVLDAGHGGYDNGASHSGTLEKNLNLKMIYTLMKGYFNSNNGDTKAYWTRRTDKFITLDTRAKFAAKVNADLFISLHMNCATNTSANGTEVYYSVSNNKKAKSGLTSKKLATLMDKKLVTTLETVDRGVKTAGFYVIKNNSVPAILVELGFISGNKDYKSLTSTSFQKKSTKTIYQVIESIFKTYPTGR